MGKKKQVYTPAQALVHRLDGLWGLRDPECYGRCNECPYEVVQETIAFLRALNTNKE